MAEALYTAEDPGLDFKSPVSDPLTTALLNSYNSSKSQLQSMILAQANKYIPKQFVGGVSLTLNSPSPVQLGQPLIRGFTDVSKQQFGLDILIPDNQFTAQVSIPTAWCMGIISTAILGDPLAGPAAIAACTTYSFTAHVDVEMGFILGIQNNTLTVSTAAAQIFNVKITGNNAISQVVTALQNGLAPLYVDESIGMPNNIGSTVNAISQKTLAAAFAAYNGKYFGGSTISVVSDSQADLHFILTKASCIVPGNVTVATNCGTRVCVSPANASACLASGGCAKDPGHAAYPFQSAPTGVQFMQLCSPVGVKSAVSCPPYTIPAAGPPDLDLKDPAGSWILKQQPNQCNPGASCAGVPSCICAAQGGTWVQGQLTVGGKLQESWFCDFGGTKCASTDATCICQNHGGHMQGSNCVGASCAAGQTGTYPNCKNQCASGQTGIWPACKGTSQ